MLYFELIDKNRLKLVKADLNLEKTQFANFFKKKSKASEFNKLVSRGVWDGYDKFLSKDDTVPVGLWREIYHFSETSKIDVRIKGLDEYLNFDLERIQFDDFVAQLYAGVKTDKGEDFLPRDYQIEGAYRALKYKFCCEEIATSAGKTSLFYTFNSYLKHIGIIDGLNKALLIVPNVSLVNQTVDAFKQYSNGFVEWKIQALGGDNDSFDFNEFLECNLLITTYQSLINLIPYCLEKKLSNLIKKGNKEASSEKTSEEITRTQLKLGEARERNICDYFVIVNVDEAHKSRGDSISDILSSCKNWKYRLGLSGTLKVDEQYSDFFRMQQNIGPLVMTLDAKFLIDNEYSPEIRIRRVLLQYNAADPAVKEYLNIQRDPKLKKSIKDQFSDPKDFGLYLSDVELKIIYDSKPRLDFITNLIEKLSNNILILFSDIKNQYGQQIANSIRSLEKHKVFYIDGSIKTGDRDEYKKVMEQEEGVVIVASYGTFATGIDLKNVFHIVLAESTKSEITVRQTIGRGMRYLKGKNRVVIWDLIDNLSGYSVRHSEVRLDIYREQKFTILEDKTVNLK
jgi:superfamily II DNA or RNA helicase